MPQYNLFSISLISAGLALFYSTSLRDLPSRKRVLPAFIGSFIRAPRFVAPRLSRDQGFCYIAQTDVDTVDSATGMSPFVVLENGRALSRPFHHLPGANKITVQAVREHGEGRYIHIGRQIFFSPNDKGDPAGRKYLLLETLTVDAEKLRMLLAVNQARATTGNAGAWLLAKLQIYAGDLLKVGRTDTGLPDTVTLADVQVDLTRYGLPRLQGRDATIRWSAQPEAAWNHVTFELRGLAADGLPADAWLVCRLGYSADYRLRLEQLDLGHGDITWLHGRFDWSDEGLLSGEIACSDVTPLRQALTDACGGGAVQRDWITSFIGAIRSGDLPLGAIPDAETAATLITAFSPDGSISALTLRLSRMADVVTVSCRSMGEVA